jgi:hypothetical protein
LTTAALSGAAALQVGSLVRARWSALVGGSPSLEAAFALESTLDELIFVLGPALKLFSNRMNLSEKEPSAFQLLFRAEMLKC